MPMDELGKTKRGPTLVRWQRAIRDTAFDLIRDLPILETQAEHFLKVLYVGTVSTNVFLRRIHNFALDMGWLPWPVVVKRQWGGSTGGTGWRENRSPHLTYIAGVKTVWHGASHFYPDDHGTYHNAGFDCPDLLWRALIGRMSG